MGQSEFAIDAQDIYVDYLIPSSSMLSFRQYLFSLGREPLFQRKEVLKGITLQIKKGECFGVLGTNGSGKSTFMRTISGIIEPSKGSLRVEGKMAPVLGIGVGVEPELTGYENIRLCCTLLRYSADKTESLISKIRDFSELSDLDLNMQVKKYSSGMVSRLGFSTAIAEVPDILIVDEALAVGDLAFQEKCRDRISEIIAQNKTVLMVTQNPQEMLNICQRAAILDKGKLIEIGNVKDIAEKYLRKMEEQKNRVYQN